METVKWNLPETKEEMIEWIGGMRKMKHPWVAKYPTSMSNEQVYDALEASGLMN